MDSASPNATCIAGNRSTATGAFNTFAFTFSKLAEKPVMARHDRRSRHYHRSPAGQGTPQ